MHYQNIEFNLPAKKERNLVRDRGEVIIAKDEIAYEKAIR